MKPPDYLFLTIYGILRIGNIVSDLLIADMVTFGPLNLGNLDRGRHKLYTYALRPLLRVIYCRQTLFRGYMERGKGGNVKE
jgi:hypothetical protein